MLRLIDSFADQLKESIALGEGMNSFQSKEPIHNVIITGMGGSGIGGKIVSQMTAFDCNIPISANCDYYIPAYANQNTLLIVSSYSGNTEETIAAMEQGIKQGCEVACIASGGKIEELAKKHGFNFVKIPSGQPPRAMFAYSAIQQLFVLNNYGVIDKTIVNQLKDAQSLLEDEKENIKTEAKELADKLEGRIPLLYTDNWLEGVAIRWCQQINENSKMLCWTNPFPENNHNEFVGWEGADNRIGVVMIKSAFDHPRSLLRMDICLPVYEKYCDTICHVNAKGKNRLETVLYTVVLGDWLSWYLSELNKVDAVEIKNILYLKGALSDNP